MKLFYFNPNGYGEEYYVMAKDKTKAYEYVLEHLQDNVNNARNSGYEQTVFNKWTNIDLKKPESLPEDYTIDELEEGQVVETETA